MKEIYIALARPQFLYVLMQLEQKIGQVASPVECYMKQHGVTEKEAKHELWKHVNDAWKNINEEFLRLMKAIPAPHCSL